LEDAHGRFADAVVAYRRALRADSNSAWARGCLAWADLRRDWTLAALYQAWRAVRLDPRYSDAYTILAGATERLGLRARARALLVRAIELDVRRNWPYLELARMNVEDGRRGAAIDVLSRLLERVPDDERGRALLGELMGVAQSPALD